MLLWIVNFMLFLFLFSFFLKTNPREVDLTTWPERSKETLRRETTLDRCHQYNTPCDVCFQINRNLWFCGLLQLAFHAADPFKAEHLQRASVCPVTTSSLSSNLTRTLTHWVLSYSPWQHWTWSLFFSSTFFSTWLLQTTVFFFFLTGHSFSAFECSLLLFNLLECPRLKSWASLSKWAHSILWLFFFLLPLCICSILVPWPGIQPVFPEVEHIVLTAGLPGEFPVLWQGYR